MICAGGHDLTNEANRRPGKGDCAICHREAQKARYHADPERHRRAALAYAQANREAVNIRRQAWRAEGCAPSDGRYAAILRRDPCCYCGDSGGEVDHINPLHAGGERVWDNLTAACRSCNARKNARPLLTFLLEKVS